MPAAITWLNSITDAQSRQVWRKLGRIQTCCWLLETLRSNSVSTAGSMNPNKSSLEQLHCCEPVVLPTSVTVRSYGLTRGECIRTLEGPRLRSLHSKNPFVWQ